MGFISVYITFPNEQSAKEITDLLIQKKCVACANLFPISSSYWWDAAIVKENEWVSIVKTTTANWTWLKEEINEIHPYDVPCIIKYEVEANDAYEAWIRSSVHSN